MRRTGLVPLALLASACAPPPLAARGSILPLQTLRLYETGVGYFERSGKLESAAGPELPVPAGHLDDALKTLVVLDPDRRTRVSSVAFGSSLSRGMARALAGLPEGDGAPLGFEQLLGGLKGARVKVRTTTFERTGRLIDLVKGEDPRPAEADADKAKDKDKDGAEKEAAKTAPAPSMTLLMLTDGGELVRARLPEILAVEPLDPSYRLRLGAALDALSTRSAQSERLLRVLARGEKVALGYVAETPVWRSTYRLVLDPAGEAGMLEGWALVHNDTDEAWRGVKVELANGRPDAFLFPMAAPRYARRPLVTPDDELATVPQLLGQTVDAIWGDHLGDASGAGGLGLSGVGEGGGGRGEGIGLGSIGTLGHGAGTGKGGSSSLLAVGDLAAVAQAKGVEAGALFVYSLPEPLDLEPRGSALVPFSQQKVDARSIVWLESPEASARSAVRFVNSTTQTLPPGPIAFFGDGGFAGESALPRLSPGESRYLTFGADLDLELHRHGAWNRTDEPQHLVWEKDSRTLAEHYLRTTDAGFEIENRSGHPRVVVLVMPIASNATLTGVDRVEFDTTTGHPLAVFLVDPKKRVERRTHSVEGLVERASGTSLTATWLAGLASQSSLPAGERAVANEALARLKESEDSKASADRAAADIAQVEKDLGRFQEHMKAFQGERGAGAGPNPFAARVLAAEDKMAQLRLQRTKLEAEARARRDAAEAVLARLVVPT